MGVGVFIGVVLTLAPSVIAGERVDLFTPDGKRAGYAVIQGDRVDFYDKDSRRIGWGKLQPSGEVEQFDLQGRRQEEMVLPLPLRPPER